MTTIADHRPAKHQKTQETDMATELVNSPDMQTFLDKIAGLDVPGGDARLKQITRRVIGDLFAAIEDLAITDDEFWQAVTFIQNGAQEIGLWAAGLGFERFLDVRADIADRKAGIAGVTPRTIEGPLYVEGAPLSDGEARLDDGVDQGEVLVMHGQVTDEQGAPVVGAIVDIWHANSNGGYSYFDQSQSAYNLRRRIRTGADGRYKFRSIVPVGYSVPQGGSTNRILDAIGRHGHRPAHIHFFVSADGYRHLTTQINIDGDPYLHDDFAYATKDELIPPVQRREDPAAVHAEGLNGAFSEVEFNFTLPRARGADEVVPSARPRVAAL
jgi:catechol 1,2-dioxygenase